MKTIDCEYFRENIKNVIQNSNLNIGIIYYIIKDIFNEIESLYYNQIDYEVSQQKENIDEIEKGEEK
jgi:hypothetical protein